MSEDGTNYSDTTTIPTSGYTFKKSECTVNGNPDNSITVEYNNGKVNFLGVTQSKTKCTLYFDKIIDTEKPIISNVTTSVTKNEINVTVTATDNIGVTEYWYQLGSASAVKGTGNTYKFSGLNPGATYTVKVYVKDAAGNQSAVTTKNVQTEYETVTIKNNYGSYTLLVSNDNGASWSEVSGTPDFTLRVGSKVKCSDTYVHLCSTLTCNGNGSSQPGYLGYANNSNIYTIVGTEKSLYFCFAEDTLVAMYDDKKKRKLKRKIKDIKPGDKVYTYDYEKGEMYLATVKKVEIFASNELCTITLKGGEKIQSSSEHVFYVENRGAVLAKELTKGLKLMGMYGINYEVESVEIEYFNDENRVKLYNVVLEKGNSFFVSSLKIMSYTSAIAIAGVTKKNVVIASAV